MCLGTVLFCVAGRWPRAFSIKIHLFMFTLGFFFLFYNPIPFALQVTNKLPNLRDLRVRLS